MTNKVALDTNAYKALREGNGKVVTFVKGSITVGLPIAVLGELYFGFENGSKKEENLLELSKLLKTPTLEILQINGVTAKIFGEIATELTKKGRPIQQNDIWIAALCKQYNYTLITADKGFANVSGLNVIAF